MKTLLILRHAKSSWKNAALADHDRPLNGRGKRDAQRMGELLADEDLTPDLIVSSTAKRARKTAAKVAEICRCERAIELRDDLYHAHPQTCISVLSEVYYDDPCVMIVGHNPGLEELLEITSGVCARLRTATLAQVMLPIESWQDLTVETEGALANLWQPRELD